MSNDLKKIVLMALYHAPSLLLWKPDLVQAIHDDQRFSTLRIQTIDQLLEHMITGGVIGHDPDGTYFIPQNVRNTLDILEDKYYER